MPQVCTSRSSRTARRMVAIRALWVTPVIWFIPTTTGATTGAGFGSLTFGALGVFGAAVPPHALAVHFSVASAPIETRVALPRLQAGSHTGRPSRSALMALWTTPVLQLIAFVVAISVSFSGRFGGFQAPPSTPITLPAHAEIVNPLRVFLLSGARHFARGPRPRANRSADASPTLGQQVGEPAVGIGAGLVAVAVDALGVVPDPGTVGGAVERRTGHGEVAGGVAVGVFLDGAGRNGESGDHQRENDGLEALGELHAGQGLGGHGTLGGHRGVLSRFARGLPGAPLNTHNVTRSRGNSQPPPSVVEPTAAGVQHTGRPAARRCARMSRARSRTSATAASSSARCRNVERSSRVTTRHASRCSPRSRAARARRSCQYTWSRRTASISLASFAVTVVLPEGSSM